MTWEPHFWQAAQNHSKESDHYLLDQMQGSLTLKLLVTIIQDYLHASNISAKDIEGLSICPGNHAVWKVSFHHPVATLAPDYIRIHSEHDIPGGGEHKSHDEGLCGFDCSLISGSFEYSPIAIDHPHYDHATPMAVGIIDKVGFASNGLRGHADALRDIISHGEHVQAVAIPLVDSADHEPTIFDLICTLYDKPKIDSVQVINISQGYYSMHEHPVLKKALKRVDKPVVCSAGNHGVDTDEAKHWPSGFSSKLENVISVGYLENGISDPRISENSNIGHETVSLFAKGDFGDSIKGTSFAAAWTSRAVASAFAMEKTTDFDLQKITDKFKEEGPFTIEEKERDPSQTKIRIY